MKLTTEIREWLRTATEEEFAQAVLDNRGSNGWPYKLLKQKSDYIQKLEGKVSHLENPSPHWNL